MQRGHPQVPPLQCAAMSRSIEAGSLIIRRAMPARSHLQLIYINPGEADDRADLADDDDESAASGPHLTRGRRAPPGSPTPISLEEAFKQYAPHVAAIGFR